MFSEMLDGAVGGSPPKGHWTQAIDSPHPSERRRMLVALTMHAYAVNPRTRPARGQQQVIQGTSLLSLLFWPDRADCLRRR